MFVTLLFFGSIAPVAAANPCTNVKCDRGETCLPTFNETSYICVDCPDDCNAPPSYDSCSPCNAADYYNFARSQQFWRQSMMRQGFQSGYPPRQSVCGDDNVTYPSECEMRRHACSSKTAIVKKFNGKCNPCVGVRCRAGGICKLNKNRQPICFCAEKCPRIRRPLCGTDGETYPNECYLKKAACLQDRTIDMAYPGPCDEKTSACKIKICKRGQQCVLRGIEPECECNETPCQEIYEPVCGSDGIVYDNQCELDQMNCRLNKTHISVYTLYPGRCRNGAVGPKLLNDTCVSSEQCRNATRNTMCYVEKTTDTREGRCQCISGYQPFDVPQTNTNLRICRGNRRQLGDNCSQESNSCDGTEHAICKELSEEHRICMCNESTLYVVEDFKNNLCVPPGNPVKLGDRCWNNSQCASITNSSYCKLDGKIIGTCQDEDETTQQELDGAIASESPFSRVVERGSKEWNELCSNDLDCTDKTMVCLQGKCTCKIGFKNDGLQCIPNNFESKVSGLRILRFSPSTSILLRPHHIMTRVKRHKIDDDYNLNIAFQFMTETDFGSILSLFWKPKSEKSGQNVHYILVGLQNGALDVEYQLSDATQTVSASKNDVMLLRWHSFEITLDKSDGMIIKFDNDRAEGQVKTIVPLMNSSQFELYIYVGALPSTAVHKGDAVDGFSGAIVNLIINDQLYDFGRDIAKDLSSDTAKEFLDDPCTAQPCLNNGSCVFIRQSEYTCLCRSPFVGPNCEEGNICQSAEHHCGEKSKCLSRTAGAAACICDTQKFGIYCNESFQADMFPFFTELHSFLQLSVAKDAKLDVSAKLYAWIVFEVHSIGSANQILLYIGPNVFHRNIDHFLVFVDLEGHVCISFNLGGGQTHVRSELPAVAHEAMAVRLVRVEQDLRLEFRRAVTFAKSPGRSTMLDVKPLNIFAGGVADFSNGFTEYRALNGVVWHLWINGVYFYPNRHAIRSSGVAPRRQIDSCSCENILTCQHMPTALHTEPISKTRCICDVGNFGNECTTSAPAITNTIRFTGARSYKVDKQKLKRVKDEDGDFSWKVVIKTSKLDGLVLVHGDPHGVYLSLYVEGGFLVAEFSSQQNDTSVLISHFPISDARWHEAEVQSNEEHSLMLTVDGFKSSMPSAVEQFNLEYLDDYDIYLGGLPSEMIGHTKVARKLKENFDGCVSDRIHMGRKSAVIKDLGISTYSNCQK